jgi:aminocarboxymuconate-semialdehyde decarboxylase
MRSWRWHGSFRAATSRATAAPRFPCPWVPPRLPAFLLGRLKRNHKITSGTADPAEGLPLLYTDSILHDRVLRFVVEMIGADRVMMGSDMPFPIGDEEHSRIVAAAGPKPDQIASITGGLAQKLFRIG